MSFFHCFFFSICQKLHLCVFFHSTLMLNLHFVFVVTTLIFVVQGIDFDIGPIADLRKVIGSLCSENKEGPFASCCSSNANGQHLSRANTSGCCFFESVLIQNVLIMSDQITSMFVFKPVSFLFSLLLSLVKEVSRTKASQHFPQEFSNKSKN